jgi:hypothetical protein
VAAVLLWGFLAIIVLAMISGARELMTPGAWRKQGYTYKLDEGERGPANVASATLRKQHLEQLRTALLQFAATHNGRFPAREEVAQIPGDLWELPESTGLRYLYVSSLSANSSPSLLVYEPELDSERRLVLRTNGEIVTLRTSEVNEALKTGERP